MLAPSTVAFEIREKLANWILCWKITDFDWETCAQYYTESSEILFSYS